jgi:N-hydroxyarylamine O-acetyltransferase
VSFDFDAYLVRIGLAEVRPDEAGLRALQKAQVRAIPFENFDPLLGKVPGLGLAEVFAKCVPGRRGGYCFELNTLFEAALKAAGFSTRRMLCRVRLRGGPDSPRSHLVLRVDLPEGSFLADAGFGGPGSVAPLGLVHDVEQHLPNGTFRLVKDDATGETVFERREGEGWQQLYAFDGAHVTDGEVAAANYVSATWDAAPFGAHAMLGSYSGDLRYGLFDRRLTVTGPTGEEQRELAAFEEFHEVVTGSMGIALDRASLECAWAKIGGG